MLKTQLQGFGGVVTTVALEDGALHTGTTQDCTPIAEYAKALHNAGHVGSKDMRLAASVPFVIVEKYLNDHNLTMQEFQRSPEHVKRLLNDPANDAFRIWKGRV